jgi:hypothetical protein
MKTMKFLFPTVAMFIISIGTALSWQGGTITEEIKTSISKMDAVKLAGYFSSTVNLEIIEIDGNYSRKQAEIIVQDFFRKHPVKTFTVNHQGSSNDGSKYMIGVYTTTQNKVYRVYIMLKTLDDKLQINKLQIEED